MSRYKRHIPPFSFPLHLHDVKQPNVSRFAWVEDPKNTFVPYFDYENDTKSFIRQDNLDKEYCKTNKYNEMILGISTKIISILHKMFAKGMQLGVLTESKRGAEVSKNYLRDNATGLETLIGQDMRKYTIMWDSTYLPHSHKEYRRLKMYFDSELIYCTNC